MTFSLVLLLAAAPASTPTDVVKAVTAERKAAVAPEKLSSALAAHVDFTELARRSLEGQWTKMDGAQRKVFAETLRALLQANWLQKLVSDRDAKVQFGSERLDGEVASVETTIDLGGDPLPVLYHLHKSADGRWKIFDVVTDGASLVELYQVQFRKQLAASGYEGLLRTLQAKVAQLQSTQGAKTVAR